jgi:mannose-6-phosphate isomerase
MIVPTPSQLTPGYTVDVRPWGHFELLVLNAPVSVKIISVEPGHRLSLQTHALRDEWWTALDDGLYVVVDGEREAFPKGEKMWIPSGTPHRVGNDGGGAARFLEIAFGCFDEDDIERLADDYPREPLPPRQRTHRN